MTHIPNQYAYSLLRPTLVLIQARLKNILILVLLLRMSLDFIMVVMMKTAH